DLADVQALDPLRSPLGADFLTRQSPYFFRVRLEKSEVQRLPEAVDEELFEVPLGADGEQAGLQVTTSDPAHPDESEVQDRPLAHADRVIEEFPQIIDPRFAIPQQHYSVVRPGIRPGAGSHRTMLL